MRKYKIIDIIKKNFAILKLNEIFKISGGLLNESTKNISS
jgi:hypothetical protein